MNNKLSTIKCKKCQRVMHEQLQSSGDNEQNPLDESSTYYKCELCNSQVEMTHIQSLLTSTLSALFVGGFAFYFLFTGLFDFIIYAITTGFLEALLGIGLIVVSLFFTLGPLWMFYRSYEKVKQRLSYTYVTKEQTNKKRILLALLLSVFPIVLAVGFGYVDHYLFPIEEWMLYLLLPIVFSPFIFAKKFRSSPVDVFYGLLFWATTLYGLVSVFK